MKHIILSLCLLLALACACTETTQFRIQPELKPYYDSFMVESTRPHYHITTQLDDISNLMMSIRPNTLHDYGGLAVTRKIPGGGQHYIYVDQDYYNTHSPECIQVIVYHELGHCYLNRQHTTTFSIMNPQYASKGWPTCNGDSYNCAAKRKWFITELFYNQ